MELTHVHRRDVPVPGDGLVDDHMRRVGQRFVFVVKVFEGDDAVVYPVLPSFASLRALVMAFVRSRNERFIIVLSGAVDEAALGRRAHRLLHIAYQPRVKRRANV